MSRDWFISVRQDQSSGSISLDLDARVLSFEFEDGEGEADKCKLVLDNRDLVMGESKIWTRGNQVLFRFGSSGRVSPERRMQIRKSKTTSWTLEVHMYAVSYLLDTEKRSVSYGSVSRSQAVTIVANRNGYGADARNIEDTVDILESVNQSNETDVQFLQRLARQEGMFFHIDSNGFNWSSRDIRQAPVREFIWYNGTGLVKSWEIVGDTSRKPSVWRVQGRDRRKKKEYQFDITVNDVNEALAPITDLPLGQGVLISTVAQIGASAVIHVVRSTEKTEAAARRVYERRARRNRQRNIKMRMLIVGDGSLLAKTVVKVGGVGTTYSGNYYISKAVHKGGSSGFTTDLVLLRDGRNRRPGGEALFERSASSSGGTKRAEDSDCSRDISAIRDALSRAIDTRNSEVQDAAGRGEKFTEKSLRVTNEKLQSLVRTLPILEEARPEERTALLSQMLGDAGGYGAAAREFPSSIVRPIGRTAADLQGSILRATKSCAIEKGPPINDADVRDQNAPFTLEEVGDGRFRQR